MPVTSFSTMVGMIRDYWLEAGVPQDLYSEASPCWAMMSKANDGRFKGGSEGAPQMKYGLKVGLPGAGSPTLANAWTNPMSTVNKRVEVTHNQLFQVYKLDWDVLEFGSDDDVAYERAQLHASEGTVKRFQNMMSTHWWGNGGGAIGRLSGTGVVINATNVINFKNHNCLIRIEVGDRLQFSATDGTSGSVLSVVKTVTAKNEDTGDVTLDSDLVTGDAVSDNFYVFWADHFGAVFEGFFSWCPKSATVAATPFFNIDRASNVTRLGGRRKLIKVGDDAWTVLTEALQIADIGSAHYDCFFVPPNVVKELLNSAREQHLLAGSNGVGAPVKSDPKNLRYGVEGLKIRWPERNGWIYIYGDRYLCDIEVTKDNDYTFVGTRMSDWLFATGRTGLSFKDYDNNGPLYQELGAERIGAVYGAKGQVVTRNTNNNIVLSPSVS